MLLASVSTALFVAGVLVPVALTGGGYPSLFAEPETIRAYFQDNSGAVRIGAFLHFGSAVPLAIYTATAWARLQHLGIRNPGATIALVGGVLAAAFLSLSAMVSATLTRAEVLAEPALIPVLQYLSFVTGGPGSVVPFGLLLAGIAVPGLIVGLLPRWLAIAGLVLAAIAELSTLVLLFDGAAYLVPVARFGGLAWLIVAGVRLPKHRTAANA